MKRPYVRRVGATMFRYPDPECGFSGTKQDAYDEVAGSMIYDKDPPYNRRDGDVDVMLKVRERLARWLQWADDKKFGANDGRCSSCKHWVDLRKLENDPKTFGLCARGDFNTHELPYAAAPDTLMWGNDASDFKARVCTLPNFGCVMYEAGPNLEPRSDDWAASDHRKETE